MKYLLNFTFKQLPKTGCKILILIALTLSPIIQGYAQAPIDVTDEHAKLGRTFADLVWKASETGTISLPVTEELSGGDGETIQIEFKNPISKRDFKSAVSQVVKDHEVIINTKGGWGEDNENVFSFFWLNSDADDGSLRATTMVLYNVLAGTAVFITTSEQPE